MTRLREIRAALEQDERLLARALDEKVAAAEKRVFRLLGLVYPSRDLYNAYLGYASGEPSGRVRSSCWRTSCIGRIARPGAARARSGATTGVVQRRNSRCRAVGGR